MQLWLVQKDGESEEEEAEEEEIEAEGEAESESDEDEEESTDPLRAHFDGYDIDDDDVVTLQGKTKGIRYKTHDASSWADMIDEEDVEVKVSECKIQSHKRQTVTHISQIILWLQQIYDVLVTSLDFEYNINWWIWNYSFYFSPAL